jgi:hypothetical protein
VPKTHRTVGIEFGLWLLKTPTVMDGEVSSGKKNPVSGNSGTLAQEIMSEYQPTMQKLGLLPTPKAREAPDCPAERKRHSPSMESLAVMGMLPTPAAADGFKTTSNSHQVNLNMLAPVGTDSQLNPLFVMEMMGFPPDWTELPFLNGGQKV